MFERFTERARRVLFFARYEASQLGSIGIEPEHLLLGLVREGKGLTSTLFGRANLSLASIRQQIEGRVTFREKVSTSVEIPFSAATKRAMQFAADEADRLLHNYIGTEHLLLGLLREERSVAATVLTEAGLSLAQVRGDMETLLNERPPRDSQDSSPGEGRHHAAFEENSPYGQHPFSRMRVPIYVPSTVVHIALSRQQAHAAQLAVGPHHWLALDAPLRYVIARLHFVRDERVRFADSRFDELSFDVALLLPTDRTDGEPAETLVLNALADQLKVRITREVTPDGDVVTVSPLQ
jgi:hypothetical protein